MDNKKVDLRFYVDYAMTDPFLILFKGGFVRKTLYDYDLSASQLRNQEIHLTNTGI